MLGLFLRQWRRLLVGAFLLEAFLLAGILAGVWEPIDDGGRPLILAAAVLIVVVGASALVLLGLSALLPSEVGFVERVGPGLVLTAATEPLDDWLQLPPTAAFLRVVGLMIAANWLINGRWQSRFARRGRPTVAGFHVPIPPEDVRRRLRPDPKQAGCHYWPGTRFLPPPPGSEADFVMVRPRRSGLPDAMLLTGVIDHETGRGFTVTEWPVVEDGTPHVRQEFGLDPVPGGTAVTVRQTVLRARPGQHLFWWLGQDLKDHCASMRARLLGRWDLSLHGRQMARLPRAAG